MAHKHSVYDSDTHFSIDPIMRTLRNESSSKTSLIQYDHNSERFTFDLPRYIEGHDMLQCNVIQIHYININSATKEQKCGLYEVDDMQISPADNKVVIMSWLISDNATQYVGTLSFLIRFKCVDDEGNVGYRWHTAVSNAISIGTGMNNDAAIVEGYEDIIEQWRISLGGKEVQSITSIDTIYEDASDLPTLTADDNGTRYVAKTNGGLPFIIYSWNSATNTWVKVDEVRGKTIYYVQHKDFFDNVLYRFHSCDKVFVPLQVETQINLSNVDNIYLSVTDLKNNVTNATNGDNRLVSNNGKAPIYCYSYVAATDTWVKRFQLNNHTIYMCNSASTKYNAPAYSLYRCRPNRLDFARVGVPKTETWTFTLEDGSTVTKEVCVK